MLSPLAEELLLDKELESLELWDPGEVRSLIRQAKSGRGNLGMRMWALINFAMWYRHWMRGEDVTP